MSTDSDDRPGVHIDPGFDPRAWCETTIAEMAYSEPLCLENRCPHCDLPIRFPVIARARDIARAEKLIRTIGHYMDKYGLTDQILDDVFRACFDALDRLPPPEPSS